MVTLPGLEVVFIASPHAFHEEMVERALDQDLHIICEKPLSLSLEGIKHLRKKSSINQKLHVVNQQLPFFPQFVEVRRIIEQGEIGLPYFVRIAFQTDRLVVPGITWRWWFDELKGGGMVHAMASHFLKLLQYWFGPSINLINAYTSSVVDEISKNCGEKRPLKAESLFHAQMELQNGAVADLFCTGVSYRETQLEIGIYGTIGEIYYSSLHNKTVFYKFDSDGKRISKQLGQLSSLEKEEHKQSPFTIGFENFVHELPKFLGNYHRALDDNRLTTFDDFYSQFQVVEAIRQSINANGVQH